MSPVDWERHDRSVETADACTGCLHHLEHCVCPTRLPVRLRLVHTEQPTERERREHRLARVHHLPQNDDGARLHPDAA